MTTNVYIDGLNLYYGALKHTPFKWLNLAKLCELLLPASDVNRIEYFTALVRPRSEGPGPRLRQQVYLRALYEYGFRGNYDMAVLVTNDSGLLEPIRIVREELGLVVGILNPHKRASNVLRRQASFMKPIRSGVLRVSQFPTEIHDQQGVFRKPEGW